MLVVVQKCMGCVKLVFSFHYFESALEQDDDA